jgi:hypothetical protein
MNRDQTPRDITNPQPCYIRMVLVKHGPPVAARIFHRLGMLAAEINGQSADVDRVWTSGELIDESTYNVMMRDPPPAPHIPVYVSSAGLMDQAREEEERLWWLTRPIT